MSPLLIQTLPPPQPKTPLQERQQWETFTSNRPANMEKGLFWFFSLAKPRVHLRHLSADAASPPGSRGNPPSGKMRLGKIMTQGGETGIRSGT